MTSAAFPSTGQGSELEVAVWRAATGKRMTQQTAPLRDVLWLCLAPGGQTLAAVGKDRNLWLGNLSTATWRRLGENPGHIVALAFSAEAGLLATADSRNIMTVWEVTTTDGQPRMSHEVAAGPVTAVAFARDGTVLAGAAFDKTIRLWDVATGKELGVLPKQAHIVATLAFSPDGQTLASGDRCGGVTLWDRTTGDVRATLATAENEVFMNEVTALVFSPDGETSAVAVERTVRLWEVASGRLLARLEGHAGKVKCLAFSPDGTRLASGGYDRTLRLWDVAQYRPMNP